MIDLWIEQTGRSPPKAASTSVILRAVAYATQEQQLGGLKNHELRALHKIGDKADGSRPKGPRNRETTASGGAPSADAESRSGVGTRGPHATEGRSPPNATISPMLRPGTRLVRQWQGRSHAVDVQADGFAWNGTVYRSLSAVALAITGARWSGNRFFRL